MSRLFDKIQKAEPGVFLYSLTPPAEEITSEKLYELNRRRAARLSTLDIDGLSIYDVQEERDRKEEKRTFPYRPTLNPLSYGKAMKEHCNTEQIIYLVAGKYSEEQLHRIFRNYPGALFVPVGSPSSSSEARTTLGRSLELSSEYTNPIGSVLIGERNNPGGGEIDRMMSKIEGGVDFFISQCVYNGSLYEKLIDDYLLESKIYGYPLKPIILTFSPVGDRNSLKFMKWLGINFSEEFEKNLPESEKFLKYSIQYLEKIGIRLINTAMERNIPIGLNFESVIGRREEVLASLSLAENLSSYLRSHSLSNFTKNLKSGESALSRR